MPPTSDEVRPDRTFTHESAVTSGFGSAPQDESKQAGSVTDIQLSSFQKLDPKTEFFSKVDETKNQKRNFAPSTLPDFINPVIPNPGLFSLGFGESSCLAISFESEKANQLPEITEIDREKVAVSHF